MLTDAEFHKLHQQADRRGKTVTVSTEALRHLLHDLSEALGRLTEQGRHLTAPGGPKPVSGPPRGRRKPDPIEEDLIG